MWLTHRDDQSATVCRFNDRSVKIDLGDGLFIHSETVVSAPGPDDTIDIHIGVAGGRLVADRVEVKRLESGAGITSELLRRIPVATLVRFGAHAVQYVHGRRESGGLTVGAAWPSEEEGAYVARHGLDDETLKIVARTYRVAYLIGDSPTKKVEELLELPRSTAGRWVAAARERGYLSESRGAGKAGA